MKKFLILSALILSLTIIFLACSEERDHANPFDPEYWDSDVPGLADFILENSAIDTIKLSWTNTSELPERYSYRIDKKVASGDWIESYKHLASNIKTCKDYVEINQTISYRAFIIYDENISDKKEKIIENIFPAPTGLIATQTSITSADLSWNDNSIGEDKFEIERKLSTDSAFIKIADVTGSDTITKNWNDTTTIPTQTYDYRVRAVKGTNYSTYFTKTDYINTFQAPTGLTATQNNVYTFTLNWTDNSIAEDGYKIERKIDDAAYTLIATVTGTSFVDNTVLKKGYSSVYYQVRAYKGTDYYSTYTSTNTSVSFPAPTNIIFTKENIYTIKLDWVDNSSGEEGFKIDKKIGTDNWIIGFATLGENIETWSDTNAELNQSITYRVYAYKGTNSTVSITTTSIDTTFPPPTNLTTVQTSITSANLNWTDNSVGEDKFEIERKLSTESNYIKIAEVLGSNTATKIYSDTTLEPTKTYDYRVRAVKGTDSSIFILKSYVNTLSAPSNLVVTQMSITSSNLIWSDNCVGEDKFEIERKLSTDSLYLKIAEVLGNDLGTKSYNDSTLEPTKTYNYRVKSVIGVNSSAYTEQFYLNSFPLPSNLTLMTAPDASIKLNWTDNSYGEQGFTVDRKVSIEGSWITGYSSVSANTTTWTDTELIEGTTYFYRVNAFFQTYNSNYSNEADAVVVTSGFISVPTGSFNMGQDSVETPVHTVIVTRPYYLGKYELTQKDWKQYMPADTFDYGAGDNYPVYYINWYEILVYCNKRSMAENLTPCYTISSSTDPSVWGTVPTSSNSTWNAVTCNFLAKGYRLPTEAEWEYAARYNDSRTYPWGETEPTSTLCNYNSNVGQTTAVGDYPLGISSLGFLDVTGNVREFVWDWEATYPSITETDPDGPDTATNSLRVLRGGGWYGSDNLIKCAARGGAGPSVSSMNIGFRLARTK